MCLKALIHNVMVFGDGAFGTYLGLVENGSGAPWWDWWLYKGMKGPQLCASLSLPHEDTASWCLSANQEEVPPQELNQLALDFPALRTVRNDCCWSYLVPDSGRAVSTDEDLGQIIFKNLFIGTLGFWGSYYEIFAYIIRLLLHYNWCRVFSNIVWVLIL